jgi:hypothetical protein
MTRRGRFSRTGVLAGVFLLSVVAIGGPARPVAARGAQATARPRDRGERASRGRLVIPKGTEVTVAFDQALSSKTARVGQQVRLRVADDVFVGRQKVIARGTPVQGDISKVSTRKNYGRNAEMRIVLRPVASVTGVAVPLEAGGKGDVIGGRKSAQAAGATVGGAVALGPVGLVGGYFVHGKPVTIKKGDTLVTQVPQEVVLRRR